MVQLRIQGIGPSKPHKGQHSAEKRGYKFTYGVGF